MALLNFGFKDVPAVEVNPQVETFMKDFSIEVMPRTAEKVEDFRDFLPGATRVYVAHIEGTPIEDMVATAKRLAAEGYDECRISRRGSSRTKRRCAIGLPCIKVRLTLSRP